MADTTADSRQDPWGLGKSISTFPKKGQEAFLKDRRAMYPENKQYMIETSKQALFQDNNPLYSQDHEIRGYAFLLLASPSSPVFIGISWVKPLANGLLVSFGSFVLYYAAPVQAETKIVRVACRIHMAA